MEMSVPIENQEIPQAGFGETTIYRKANAVKLPKVKGLKLEYSAGKKELQAGWDSLDGTDYYTYQFYTSAVNPDDTVLKHGIVGRCEASIGGLTRGQKIYIRVRSIGYNGLGPWSESVEKKVP